MCTVTVLRSADMLRLAFNRDERRERPAAYAPFITRAGALLVLTPQDPQGSGTWIAANAAGLVFAVLNVHDGHPAAVARRSRGLIIPMLFDAATLEEVVNRVDNVTPSNFAPFRLLVADPRELVKFTIANDRLEATVRHIDHPLLFTSSSLGDAIVDGPRRMLFDQMFETAGPSSALRAGNLPAQQDAFHAHRWRDRPAVSVHMSRPEACTVSTTTVEVTPSQVRMIYQPAHFSEGTPVGLVIDRHDVGHTSAIWTRRRYAAV